MNKHLLFILLVLVPQMFISITSLARFCDVEINGIYNKSDEVGKVTEVKNPSSPYIYDIMIDGIYYKLDEGKKVAEVTFGDNDYTGDVKIPLHICYKNVIYDVVSIDYATFKGNIGLTSVAIPNSVTKIRDSTFENCSGLKSIVIPSGIDSIGEHVFLNCRSLTSIKVSPNNPTFDSRGDCNAIIETSTNKLVLGCRNTVIPEEVTAIGDDVFQVAIVFYLLISLRA